MPAFQSAVQVGAWGLGGIFGFMLVFYASIRLITALFPAEEHHHEER